ncbi:MAG: DNA mismatch repair endonuclease MutL [Chloroflexi bacterium AL-W]|nr:DNA mismatch repair endonuclease MutL [Chloroflexi bacterium AL-N1]NOK68168.1 DNA mismatch repair endonuclease MutL [Chloroflexi bacterium AL-N10]NOK73508.1 DNA mismatch repair endonuclease MutL [Chloroflexi bacterium AL-N5]NOK83422.1 DNA mismatch repair endonuclease MutL [Chloroflexi bacterium AL-W]NOK87839.1 DNA mismatch repair endonuclease MutL [Chloroflexi bacterium AL-N15]
MTIHILEPTVAAQIAAGEVVERPASVAKELIENALDAGARRISVEVRGGGLRELRIQDDGCGMAQDEVTLAFERHATSKLRVADDLWSITTLGFRGEALPSIASVAQVVCTTRAAHEEVGTELRIAGGELQSRSACGCSPGTTFSVRNLFYNVPVRRDFLRSEGTEASAIATIVTQYALAYPEVRFTLLLDQRLALQTSGSGAVREVMVELYGFDVARQLLPLDVQYGEGSDSIRIQGLVSPPGVTRSSRGYLHLFVNRRAIQPRGQLVFVIEEAYHTLLMKGRHPLAVIDLRVHPGAVDVNIHPTKSEVKFRETPRVLGALGRSVRDALLSSGEVRPWQDAAPPPLSGETAQRRFELRHLSNREEFRQATTPWPAEGAADQHFAPPPAADQGAWERQPAADAALHPVPATEAGSAPTRLPPLRVIGQIAANYIIAEAPDGMYLIDQHAAHERIAYERLMAQRGQGAIDSQNLLIPQTVELPPASQQLILEHLDELAHWGFLIEDFGVGLRVRAVPSEIYKGNLAEALLGIADHLAGQGGETPADRREAMLITLACHSSIRSGQTLSHEEIRELITQLEHCDMPRTCPHGRPTMILVSVRQLEKQFGRVK